MRELKSQVLYQAELPAHTTPWPGIEPGAGPRQGPMLATTPPRHTFYITLSKMTLLALLEITLLIY